MQKGCFALAIGRNGEPKKRTRAVKAQLHRLDFFLEWRPIRDMDSLVQISSRNLLNLKARYPWPSEVRAEVNHQGWLLNADARILTAEAQRGRVVLELGTFLGKSALNFLTTTSCDVICVDHWQGSLEHQKNPGMTEMLQSLYETFLANCWEFRKRLVPVREDTQTGMRIIAEAGVCPDLIYIDASHDYRSVRADIETAMRLFPEATLAGHDYVPCWPEVIQAVDDLAREHGLKVASRSWCWRLVRGELPTQSDPKNAWVIRGEVSAPPKKQKKQ